MRRSRNTHLTSRGLDRGVVPEITATTHFLIINFDTRAIYIYTNLALRLPAIRESIARPVESESGIVEPTGLSHSSSHDHCHISRFWALM